jgi:hypothetical protein
MGFSRQRGAPGWGRRLHEPNPKELRQGQFARQRRERLVVIANAERAEIDLDGGYSRSTVKNVVQEKQELRRLEASVSCVRELPLLEEKSSLESR